MSLSLTAAFSANPRAQALKDGAVKAENIDLGFVTLPPGELFYRNLEYDEFDVSEMSISETLLARERSDGTRWDWSALPVFLSKAFVWLDLYVNTNSGVETLGDLRGKRVGVPDYDMTAALWMRATMKELHGIEAADVTWYNGRLQEMSHGGALGLDQDPPPGVSLNWMSRDQTLDTMLDRGELDAAYGFPRGGGPANMSGIDRYAGTPLVGNPNIRPLFPDGGKAVTAAYYRSAGIIPVNHLVIVQNRVLREHPWAALELFKAFQASKLTAYDQARRARSAYLLFEGNDFREQADLFGDDPYPLGIRANRPMLETLIASSMDQGLLRRPVQLEDIFFKTTLNT